LHVLPHHGVAGGGVQNFQPEPMCTVDAETPAQAEAAPTM
jgi:hypothetical protein